MTRTTLRSAIAAAGLCGIVQPAVADLAADCTQAARPELQIKACSIIIEDDRASEASLATAHMNRATAYARKRQYKAAMEDCDAAIAINSQDPLVYYNRGNVNFDLGNIRDAIADYTHAIELHPEFALAHFNRGLAHEKMGEKTKAAQDYRTVLALDPTLAKRARAHLDRLGRKR